MKIISSLVTIALLTTVAKTHRMHPLSDEFIDFINSKQTLWRAGRNFHRNTSLKYLKMLTGTLKNESTFDAFASKPPRYKHTYQNLPSQFDARSYWRNCSSLRDIRDQGACGSCWAVSAVSAMTDRLCVQSSGRDNFYFSEFDLMSCCRYCGLPCNGGILRTAWLYGVKTGIVSGGKYDSKEGCKPYTIPPCHHKLGHHGNMRPCGHTTPVTQCKQKCQKSFKKHYNKDQRRMAGYYYHRDVKSIMLDIFEKGPVTVSFSVFEDFFSYIGGIYYYVTGRKVGQHSVKLIGWGEDDNGVEYWIATNSWNTDWGERGFFKIVRGCNHLGIEDIAYAGLFKIKPS